ncbi:MAG: NrsF family protein [Bdellovibrionales bacterium]
MNEVEINKIEDLIGNLSEELDAVKKAKHPLVYTLPWLAMASVFSAVVVNYVGVRHDIADKLNDAAFLFEITTVAIIGLFATLASSFLMIPDMRGKKWLMPVTFTAVGLFAIWNVIKSVAQGLHAYPMSFDHCMQEGLFMAFIPMMALIFFVRGGATTRPVMMGTMNILAGAAIAYIGLRFTCSMDTVWHSLITHLTPYLVIGAGLGFAARRLYKW